MIQSLRNGREERTDSPVIVFEPVKVRNGATWRAIRIARTALLIWGGVSLAGAAAVAIGYPPGSMYPYPLTAADAPVSPAAVVPPTLAPEAPARPAAVRQILPQSAEQPTVAAAATPTAPAPAAPAEPAPAASAAAETPLIEAPAAGIAALATGGERTLSAAQPLTPFDDAEGSAQSNNAELLPDGQPGPLAVARLPRARPDAPLTIASIDEQYEPQSRRRFRRLRDVEARYRDYRYVAINRYRDYRRLHPFFYER